MKHKSSVGKIPNRVGIENRNKILRKFFPKGSNFDLILGKEILKVQTMINDRPMKTLNWHSPASVFSCLRSGCWFNVPVLSKVAHTRNKSPHITSLL